MKILKRYYLTSLWFFIMCYLLFSPSNGLPKGGVINIPHFDKIVHIGMFSILSVIVFYEAFKNSVPTRRVIIVFTLTAILFAGLSEIIQHNYIEGRNGSWFDLLADLTGLFLGYGLYRLMVLAWLQKHSF